MTLFPICPSPTRSQPSVQASGRNHPGTAAEHSRPALCAGPSRWVTSGVTGCKRCSLFAWLAHFLDFWPVSCRGLPGTVENRCSHKRLGSLRRGSSAPPRLLEDSGLHVGSNGTWCRRAVELCSVGDFPAILACLGLGARHNL